MAADDMVTTTTKKTIRENASELQRATFGFLSFFEHFQPTEEGVKKVQSLNTSGKAICLKIRPVYREGVKRMPPPSQSSKRKEKEVEEEEENKPKLKREKVETTMEADDGEFKVTKLASDGPKPSSQKAKNQTSIMSFFKKATPTHPTII